MTSTKAQAFNADFAWSHGFGGGLVSPGGCLVNPFKGLDPAGSEFWSMTCVFQTLKGIKQDGYFGADTLELYVEQYGKPDLQIEGIDISGYQRPDRISIPALKSVGLCGFAYVKFIESKYKNLAKYSLEHSLAMISNGVPHGGYLFVRTDSWYLPTFETHAKEQAQNYLRAKAQLPGTVLLDCVDAEHKGFKVKGDRVIYGHGMLNLKERDRAAYVERLTVGHAVVVETLKKETGEIPLLYSYPGYLNRYLTPVPELTQCPLWNSVRYVGSPTKYKHHRVSNKWGKLVVKQWQTDGSDPRVLEHYGRRLDINQAPYGIEPFKRG